MPATTPAFTSVLPGPQTILPGTLWPDNRGQHVQAHGGGILRLPDNLTSPTGKADEFTYFWFGEERAADLPRNQRAVSCYSSGEDAVHWTFHNDILTLNTADFANGLVLEQPKVYYNAKTKKFVMYVHFDDSGYRLAEVGISVSDKIEGPYKPTSEASARSATKSHDIGQFIDDDGTAYLIFEDRPNGWHIAKLSDDYLTVEKDVHLLPEAHGGRRHWSTTTASTTPSAATFTDWNANPNLYATAKDLAGPWSAFKDIAPAAKRPTAPIHHAPQSRRHQVHHRHLHGRHLAAQHAVGFTVFVDAAGDWGWKAGAAGAAGMDTGYQDGGGGDQEGCAGDDLACAGGSRARRGGAANAPASGTAPASGPAHRG